MEQANLFELHTFTLKITYSSSSLDGKPQLSYEKGATSLHFRGNQLRQVKTEIGTLITVTLKTVPDARIVTLSLLLPQVNVSTADLETRVAVKAIETTTRTSIGGPNLVEGQLQTYKVYSLRGKAKSVFF